MMNLSTFDRLMRHISPEPNSGCFLWMGKTDKGGYGQAWEAGKVRRVHQIMYELKYGPVPEGLELDHLCRVRCCANPAHVEAVTPKENARRALPYRIRPTHCPHGHEYTPANTRVWRGMHSCRMCGNFYTKRRRSRKDSQ